MKKEIVTVPEMKVIGINCRTKNTNEFNPATAKIGPLVNRYWSENLSARIPNRIKPNTTIVTYTNFESDEHGAYDYLMGGEVASINEIPTEFSSVTILPGKYLKITSPAGKKPNVIIETWMHIWEITKNKTLGGERLYKTDFEIYDERAADPENMVFDVYLGIA